MNDFKDYYATLGIDPKGGPERVTQEQISQAFRQKAKQTHPDSRPDGNKSERANKEFAAVKEAYDALNNPSAKSAYDAQWQVHQGWQRPRTEAGSGSTGSSRGSQSDFSGSRRERQNSEHSRFGGSESQRGSSPTYSSVQAGGAASLNLLTFTNMNKVHARISSSGNLEDFILGLSSDDKIYFQGNTGEVTNFGGHLFIQSKGGRLLLPPSSLDLEIDIESDIGVKGDLAHAGTLTAKYSIDVVVRSPLAIIVNAYNPVIKGMTQKLGEPSVYIPPKKGGRDPLVMRELTLICRAGQFVSARIIVDYKPLPQR